MTRFFTLVFSVLCTLTYANKNANFHTVSPKTGDGIISLLDRYDLNDEKCNVDKFYEINNFEKGDVLKTGIKYKIPVYIYTYNGVSIRSTIGVDDWEKALRIKEYNEQLLNKGARRSNYLDSKILWVPYHELDCKDAGHTFAKAETEKEDKNVIHYPYFGKKYSRIEKIDNSLAGKVFYVVSGHGGPDPGAMCDQPGSDMCEDEYAYDVSARLARNLMQHGAIVHLIVQDQNDGIRDGEDLICDKDEVCVGKRIPLNHKARLKQRSDAINKLYYKYKKQGIKEQKSIFIHVDSRAKSKKQDVFFIHYRNSRSGKLLAKKMQGVFEKKYNKYQAGRGYKGHVEGRGLYVIRNSMPTSLYVELANIKNTDDHRRIKKASNRQALANWLYEGLAF